MIYKLADGRKAAHLFDGWNETLVWSCLENVMGTIYADDPENPNAAMAILGDFTFFAGKLNAELVLFKPDWCCQDFMIMVPQNKDWEQIIEQCYNLVSQYNSYEMYKQLGLGVMALKDGIPVSGASSYSSYQGGIEIEIDTQETHRRKGLAYACGARLILECLERGLYPSWDAQNLWSAALAEKLGYHYDHEYVVYEIWGY